MIIMAKGKFHVKLKDDVLLSTKEKHTNSVITYANVWEYTNHSIWNAFSVIPPHNKLEQITINNNLSKIEITPSSKKRCKPVRFDLMYNMKATKDWFKANNNNILSCTKSYPRINAIKKTHEKIYRS